MVHDRRSFEQMVVIEGKLGKPMIRVATDDTDDMEAVRTCPSLSTGFSGSARRF